MSLDDLTLSKWDQFFQRNTFFHSNDFSPIKSGSQMRNEETITDISLETVSIYLQAIPPDNRNTVEF